MLFDTNAWVVSAYCLLSSSAQLSSSTTSFTMLSFISAPALYKSNGFKAKHNNLLSESLS
jgi:hypothetical protein